jgi:hypothetical protein
MSRKVKLVKTNVGPANKPLGVNPTDPWSAKAGLSEASEEMLLHQYLNSRGINPHVVTKDTKIAHSKSGEFIKWKRDHSYLTNSYEPQSKVTPAPKKPTALERFRQSSAERAKKHNEIEKNSGGMTSAIDRLEKHMNEETDKKDMVCLDIPLLIRVLEFTREEMSSDIELHNMVERLINMRNNVPLDMAHYDEITQKLVKENHIAIAMGKMLDDESGMVLSQIEELERGCAFIRAYIGKDYEKQLPAWVQAKVTLATDYMSTVGNYLISKNEKVNEAYGPTQLDHDTVKKHLKNIMAIDSDEPTATSAAHAAIKKVSTIGKTSTKSTTRQMLGALIRKHKIPIDQHHRALLNKESVEQVDEITQHRPGHPMFKSDISLYRKTPKSVAKSLATHGAKYFSNTDSGNYKTTDKEAPRYRNENTLDPLAATEAPCDGVNGGETNDRKSQMSKSARMIKALYKRKGVVKEEMFDHEKEDKSVQTYGKKPKMKQTDEKKNVGENKPEAAAVMSGGKTLTGEKRDDVEIDPMMRVKPGQNQFNKDFGKKGV